MTKSKLEDRILVQDGMGRVRTPRERREALLEEYARSGMSGPAFTERLGIKYSTFTTWVRRSKKSPSGGQQKPHGMDPVRWVEAVMAPSVAVGPSSTVQVEAGSEGGGLTIRLGGGALMAVQDERGAILAARVLKHLGEGGGC